MTQDEHDLRTVSVRLMTVSLEGKEVRSQLDMDEHQFRLMNLEG